jgi:hypothetical protein
MNIPPLPWELWEQIFRKATADEKRSRKSDVFYSLPIYSIICEKRCPKHHEFHLDVELLKTKRALTMVSRFWREISIPMLYEDVHITSAIMFSKFSRSVRASSMPLENSSSHSNFGHRVESLRITIAFDVLALSDWKIYNQSVMRALPHCPNLQRLSLLADTFPPGRLGKVWKDDPSSVLVPLPALTRVDIQCNVLGYAMIQSFAGLANIEILSLYGSELEEFPSFLSFPKLHSLRILFGDVTLLHYVSTWDMPALTTLTFDADEVEDTTLDEFFKLHGAGITWLNFLATEYVDEFKLLRWCTSLTRITVLYPLLLELPYETEPGLKRLDIYTRSSCYELFDQENDKEDIHRFVGDMHCTLYKDVFLNRHGPYLKVVRLVDFSNKDFNKWKWSKGEVEKWKRWIEVFYERDVRLEASSGRLLKMPTAMLRRVTNA